jgi:hypothetical protein
MKGRSRGTEDVVVDSCRCLPPRHRPTAPSRGCGVDQSGDPIEPHAGRGYSSALDEAQIRSFYWAELANDGWHSASTVIPAEVAPSLAFQRGISCLVRDFRGSQLRFDIRFDPIPGASVADSATSSAFHAYAVQVTVRTDRGNEGSC